MHAAWLLLAVLPAVSVPAGHREHVALPAELYELAGHAVHARTPASTPGVSTIAQPSDLSATNKTHRCRGHPTC